MSVLTQGPVNNQEVPIHAFLVAQMVKRLSTKWDTQVRALGWEDPLEKKWQSTLGLLPGESHGQRSLVGYSPWGRKEWDTTEQLHLLTHLPLLVATMSLKVFPDPVPGEQHAQMDSGYRIHQALGYIIIGYIASLSLSFLLVLFSFLNKLHGIHDTDLAIIHQMTHLYSLVHYMIRGSISINANDYYCCLTQS